jgi:SAM-dependent methyltransferase
MRISGGLQEDGIAVGNTFDKYGSRNPIVRWMMRGFDESLSALVGKVEPTTIHEIGCGEGYWVLSWNQRGIDARGSDFSTKVIELARSNAMARGVPTGRFNVRSIYDLQAGRDSADLIVCCEVLEHLEQPDEALSVLQRVATKNLIVSVPREPLWRVLNTARGKYLSDLGNTPGHIQHWSRKRFIGLLERYFDVVEVRSPLPWIMLLCRARQ